MSTHFTSRSAVEDFQTCPRYRYLRYFFGGKGLVPAYNSIPLTTGTCIHAGVQCLIESVMLHGVDSAMSNLPQHVESAVLYANKLYHDYVMSAPLTGLGTHTEIMQNYTYQEQKSLTEGLIRAWAMKELPMLVKNYRLVGAEREIVVPLPKMQGRFEYQSKVYWQARTDAELKSLADDSYLNYSLKTTARWDDKIEKSYRNDLQGITELWAVEEDNRLMNVGLEHVRSFLSEIRQSNIIKATEQNTVTDFLRNKIPQHKRIMGVKFCFLVKGKREKENANDENTKYITKSPLIRGYKKITMSSIEYAHSYWFANPNNPSGKGRLGQGWEPFNAWELGAGVKGWLKVLGLRDDSNQPRIQPSEGDVIKNQVITPLEYFRSDDEIAEAIAQVSHQEYRVFDSANQISQQDDANKTQDLLDEHFPKHRHSCHWPSECEMLDVCWKKEVGNDPIGSGLYQIRVPHHEAEREALMQ